MTAMVGAFRAAFPHTAFFGSLEGWGLHLLGSREPIPPLNAETLVARMPAEAVRDLLEWGPHATATDQFQAVLSRSYPASAFGDASPGKGALTDDRPLNEYFFLRQTYKRWRSPDR